MIMPKKKNPVCSPLAKIKIFYLICVCVDDVVRLGGGALERVQIYVWICPATTSIPVYKPKHIFDLKNSNFGCAGHGFQEKFDTPPLKPISPVSESSTHPLQTTYAFSHSPQGQGVMPINLLPVIAPRMEPSYTHSCKHKIKWDLQAQKVSFPTVPLPDNCVMTPVFQDGSLPFQYTHKPPLRQALHIQIANHHIQRATKSFFVKCWRISSKFRPAT